MYLNVHSYYSLRYGTLSVDDLMVEAKKNGVSCFALTDINTSMGIPEFVKTAKENNIKPIAGVEFHNRDSFLYVGIAKNNKGLKELNDFQTDHNLNRKSYPEKAPPFNDVVIMYPLQHIATGKLAENEYVGVRPHEVNFLIGHTVAKNRSKCIIRHPVTFSDEESFFLHKNLRAVSHNTLLSKLTPEMHALNTELMVTPEKLAGFYRDYPHILNNTAKLMDSCSIDFDFSTGKNKKIFTKSHYDDKLLLEKLALDGLKYRYGESAEARCRIKHELEVIDKLGFASYFLITWDIVRYSMSRGFYHVGRGSGANSVVAYCLKITNVDPIELDLYFERFINPKRTSPPDFDIDYSWKDRDDVQDYIFKRYGRDHTALLGATTTFKDKAIYRELGKVYGLPKEEIDSLIRHPEEEINKNRITMQIHQLAERVKGFPNIRSIHAGGILISEEPITTYTALDLPPKGFPTTQWDMYIAEDLGFEKLDILSQRGIGHIKEAADIILANRNASIDVHNIEKFKNDEKVKYQLMIGETNGCFYIESPAMRGLLKKLKCDNYISLVAASSIIRPGVAKSGMMREYIQRFHDPAKIKYLHPVMEQQLKETYGVMVYQEDVIKVAHHFAGLDLSDADILRRAMSGKYRSRKEFIRIERRFFDNCKEFGYTPELAQEVWRQIESFAGYSFSKAHSASYAVESFQSLYLKAHFPLEFMVAVINNFGGYYHSWGYFNEAERWGAKIRLPCVNNSFVNTSIRGDTIFIGFVHIQSLETRVGQDICMEREKHGEFDGLEDFIERVGCGKEQLLILIKAGAFSFTGKPKPVLLWETHLYLTREKSVVQSRPMFKTSAAKFTLPDLTQGSLEDAYDEIELLGFPVSMSPFDLLQTKFRGEARATELIRQVGKKIRMVGRLVCLKYVRTVKRDIMNFGTFTDVNREFFDTTHFAASLKKYPFQGYGIYLMLGKVVEEFGFPSIEVEKMVKLPLKGDPRA